MEPRTLVPIPTLPPLDFAVSEEDQTSFRLDWTPQVSNDCLFRNWTIEVQLDTHCISGSGYTTCTPVLNQNWTIVPSCTLTTRTEVNCKAYNLQSYSFYAVRIKEGCSDATAESAYLRWFKLRVSIVSVSGFSVSRFSVLFLTLFFLISNRRVSEKLFRDSKYHLRRLRHHSGGDLACTRDTLSVFQITVSHALLAILL
ncbi:unnamed protein product [Polarella glacialis]|uniref:Uncharacterized protein n=1 Tax=Polarella glacialis TaxID=89957 RepID=A0A813ETG6_POLGL|nr:unnamed protein product [Polarella glacialis]